MIDLCIACGIATTGHWHFTTDDVRPCCLECAKNQAVLQFAEEYWQFEMFWDFTKYPPANFFDGH